MVLRDRIFRDRPDSRVLVHTGYAGARRPDAVRGWQCNGHDVCGVTARLEAESAEAVPRDVLLLKPNDAGRTLAPRRRYVITIRDPAGTMLSDTTVTVPPR